MQAQAQKGDAMSLIVAGRFTTFPAAEAAAQRLFDHGFIEEDVSLFYVNPGGQHARFPVGGDEYADPQAAQSSKGAGKGVVIGSVIGAAVGVAIFSLFAAPVIIWIAAAGVGAYVGSLAGAMSHTSGGGKRRETVHGGSHPSGVLLAVHVTAENQQEAARLLREGGAEEIERANGRWQQRRWVDFDPTHAPQTMQTAQDSRV